MLEGRGKGHWILQSRNGDKRKIDLSLSGPTGWY